MPIYVIALGLLSACGEKPAETVYQHLETAVELEAPFEQQQEPLQQAEQKENELFEQIIALGMDEFEQISSLADEALVSVESRLTMVETEKESIEASYQEFSEIESLVGDAEEEWSSTLAELSESMEERYHTYQELYSVYTEALNKDRALFEMLKEEELTMEDLQAQIDQVNESYRDVTEKKEQFNQSTDEYNEMKRSFYEAAELNVRYE